MNVKLEQQPALLVAGAIILLEVTLVSVWKAIAKMEPPAKVIDPKI